MVNDIYKLSCNYKKVSVSCVVGCSVNGSLPRRGTVPRRLRYRSTSLFWQYVSRWRLPDTVRGV